MTTAEPAAHTPNKNPEELQLEEEVRKAEKELRDYRMTLCIVCRTEQEEGAQGWWSCPKCKEAGRAHLFCAEHQHPDVIVAHGQEQHKRGGSRKKRAADGDIKGEEKRAKKKPRKVVVTESSDSNEAH